ncbi:hypothetical protein P154DRAFT_524995 [Amniculicola lignicola CBS 123094]|uniref:Prokaryotic-type class I peptide chain release factors domain-containing protein n=1 Tax=Amniculicola lignicola CBS 123094 TaxID=1392246 RepID=A0A6A5WDH3_9PLEO|nr:hypothetical protein P154DRAFT_524995 [Amniculicola lignicola CBS 123094]
MPPLLHGLSQRCLPARTTLSTAPFRTVLHPLLPRAFTATSLQLSKQMPPRRVILDNEIIENFLRGSGPGGQKINKTSCAVQLKHLPTGIVVKCQETRSRQQNRKIARRLLGDRLEELELGEESRTAVKGREKSKKKKSAEKKRKRKYRALEGKEAGGEGGLEGQGGEDAVDGVEEEGEKVTGGEKAADGGKGG